MTNETPYRSSCEVCAARAEETKKMRPFSAARVCPACKGIANVSFYQIVCRGKGQRFILKRGRWFFGVRGEKTFDCDLVGAVEHFHLRCLNCNYRWMMETALVEEREPASVQPTKRPPNPQPEPVKGLQ